MMHLPFFRTLLLTSSRVMLLDLKVLIRNINSKMSTFSKIILGTLGGKIMTSHKQLHQNQGFQYQAKLVLVLTTLVMVLVLKSWSKPVFGIGFGFDFKICLKTGNPTIRNCQMHFHPQFTFSENMYSVMECLFAQFVTINAKQWQLTKPNLEEILHSVWCGMWGKNNTRLFGRKWLLLTNEHVATVIFNSHTTLEIVTWVSFVLFFSSSFFPLSDIMDLRHQSSAMCIIMLGGEAHTRGLQRK